MTIVPASSGNGILQKWDTKLVIFPGIWMIPSEMVIQVSMFWGCQQCLDPMTSERAKNNWDWFNEVDFTGWLILPLKISIFLQVLVIFIAPWYSIIIQLQPLRPLQAISTCTWAFNGLRDFRIRDLFHLQDSAIGNRFIWRFPNMGRTPKLSMFAILDWDFPQRDQAFF